MNKKNDTHNYSMVAICAITIILAIILVAPTVYISRYAYPWADDFNYAAETKHVYDATGSFFKAMARAFETSMESYHDFQGTYLSCFLMAMQPAAFGTRAYHLTGFIMLGIMFFAYFIFFHCLFHKAWGFSKSVAYSMFALTYIASVEMVMGIAEAFTWFCTGAHYTIIHSMFVMYVALLTSHFIEIRHDANEKNKAINIISIFFISLLGFLTAGGNFVSVFMGVVFLALLTIVSILYLKLYKHEKLNSYVSMIPLIGAYFVGSGFNLLAPGNLIRMDITGDTSSFWGTILNCFITGGYSIYKFFSVQLFVILLLILFIAWHEIASNKVFDKVSFEFPLPGFVLLLSYCLLSAEFAPINYMITETKISDVIRSAFIMNRTSTCIYHTFVLLLVFNEIYFLGWLYKKNLLKKLPLTVALVISTASLIICAVSAGKKISEDPTCFLTSAAIYNLQTGTAQYYGYLMEENTNRLKNTEDRNVLVLPITVDPSSLYPQDGADWKEGSKHFYDKDSVEYEE